MTDADLENEALLRAYHVVFGSPDGQVVLADLAKFCRAGETPFDPNQRITDVLIGRYETFLRIQMFSKLTVEQVLHVRVRGRPRTTSGDHFDFTGIEQ